MAKLPKQRPLPPQGTHPAVLFRYEMSPEYTGSKGAFRKHIFKYQIGEGSAGWMDWEDEDGTVRQIRFGGQARITDPEYLSPKTALYQFLDPALPAGWMKKLQAKQDGTLDFSPVVEGVQCQVRIEHVPRDGRTYANVVEMFPPQDGQNIEFINYFEDDKKDDDGSTPF